MSSQYKIMDDKHGTDTCRFGSFRIDVQKMAFVIASVSFVLSLFNILWAFLSYFLYHHFNVSLALINLFVAFVYLGVIEGLRKCKPMLFLPYLIFSGIGLVIDMVLLICLVVIGIWAPRELVDKWNEKFPEYKVTVEEFRVYMLLYSLFVGIFFAAGAWCYSVIYRAYKGLKNALKDSILAI